jgi:hypothetical protein
MQNLDLFEWKEERHSVEFLGSLINRAESLLLKKLARNDCSWADDPMKHQGGPFLPQAAFDTGFFPNLENINTQKPHIYEAVIEIAWLSQSEVKEGRLVHYSNKGSERHLTRVSKADFAALTPASFLLIAKIRGERRYEALTIDSATTSAEWLEDRLRLSSDFSLAMFTAEEIRINAGSEQERLIQEILEALDTKQLDPLIVNYQLRAPEQIALDAQQQFKEKNGLTSLSPFEILSPGDAIREISRDLEFDIYKKEEFKLTAVQVAKSLVSAYGVDNRRNVIGSVVKACASLDLHNVFQSAAQRRMSRGGRSFELHLSTIMQDGGVPFEAQVVSGGRRPDFVLPNSTALNSTPSDPTRACVLSAKTTVKERWKQIVLEDFGCPLFLATLDERISKPALDQMYKLNITVVVPESFKNSRITNYRKHDAVITYRHFFDKVNGKW